MGALVGPASLLLLGALGLALPPLGTEGAPATSKAADSFSLHSLRFFFTFVSDPGQGFSQFAAVGYIDSQLFYHYDSNSRRVQPRVPWMDKVDAQYWDTQTKIMQGKESEFRGHMGTLRNHYNQSEGLHTLQKMFGCELRKDGSKGNFARYAYDGRDHVSFNLGTWTAADVEAQITKTWLEGETNEDQSLKVYLEEECIEWLQKFLNFGRESLLRTESPVGKVTHQTIGGDQEALICQANGFYPKEIEATWRKGEEILEHETFRRSIAPNSDGTYYIWLSIEIDPKQRDLYQCHVDHASLTEPLVLAFKKPGS